MADEPAQPADKPALKPANQNPWYILMTLHGEQPERMSVFYFDEDLHAKNRQDWNRWAARGLKDEVRQSLLATRTADGQPRFSEAELKPHDDKEFAALTQRFREACAARGAADALPKPAAKLDFKKTHFERLVSASGFLFPGNADLRGATFSGDADLSGATFSGDAFLSGATFSGDAYLAGATFSGYAFLSDATFSGDAYFSGATFSGTACLSGATFSATTDFSNAVFKRSISFAEAKFRMHPPNFHEATLHSDTDWVGAEWPEAPAKLEAAKTHVRHYQRLKQVMETLKKHEDELDFFAREMAAQRVVDRAEGKAGRAALNWLYQASSDYGRSVARPLTQLGVVVWLAFTALVWTDQCTLSDLKLCAPDKATELLGIGKSMGLALTSAVGFLPFKKEIFGDVGAAYSTSANVVMSLESILCFALLFLAGLALRNRFRMK